MKFFGLIFLFIAALLTANVEAEPEPQFVVLGGRAPGLVPFRGLGRPFRGGFRFRRPFFG